VIGGRKATGPESVGTAGLPKEEGHQGMGIFLEKGEIPMVSRHPTRSPGRPARLETRVLIATVCLALVIALTPRTISAQPPPTPGPPLSAEGLTQILVALNVTNQLAPAAKRAQLLNDLLTVAATRQQLLAGLIESDPAEVLRITIPAHLRASLPPAVQASVEEEVEVEGELEILHEDRTDGSRYLYFLEAVASRLSLHFAADPPTHLQTGDRVRVRGVQVNQALALESGSSSVQSLAPALPNTFGAQKTLVMLVNFSDKQTQPYTVTSAQSVLTTTSNFDWETSYGQTWLTGVVDLAQAADVRGWYTIALSSTVCNYSTLASYAKQAATAAGINLSAYTRYVYAFPNNACTWWGLGTVGGNPSQAWINGSFTLKVVGHEMGHGFGLYHSRALDCGTTTLGPSCTTIEYGNPLDIMGNPSSGHFNAFQKERLGWLNYGASPPITTVSGDGTYWLDPYESLGLNPKALKILKATNLTTGKKTWYYVEYRRALGFDSFLSSNSNVLNGVVIHTGSESSGNSSDLLDMTPATSSWSDPALDVGLSFYDPDAGVTISATWAGSASAAVGVTFGGLACVQGSPTVALSPSQSQWVQAGSTVTYTVSVTNNDTAGCAASDFTLQATVPTGWMAAFAVSSRTLSPGGSASITLQVISPTTATDGFYTIGATAVNAAHATYTGSASGTYVIVSSLSIAVSTNKPSYTRNQSVSITAILTINGSPVSGASVNFAITKPNGSVVTGAATTGTSGSGVFKYRLKRQDPIGTYPVQAVGSSNGLSKGASTSFAVK